MSSFPSWSFRSQRYVEFCNKDKTFEHQKHSHFSPFPVSTLHLFPTIEIAIIALDRFINSIHVHSIDAQLKLSLQSNENCISRFSTNRWFKVRLFLVYLVFFWQRKKWFFLFDNEEMFPSSILSYCLFHHTQLKFRKIYKFNNNFFLNTCCFFLSFSISKTNR